MLYFWSGMGGLMLPRYSVLKMGLEVPTPHTGGAFWASDVGTGGLWVCKSSIIAGDDTLRAEIVGWYLGRALGAPVPDAAIFDGHHDLSPGWLSRAILGVQHWNADRLPDVINGDALGAMLVLDAVLLNGDRHERNVLLEPVTPHLAQWRVWCIDMGGAVCGWPASYSQKDLEIPDVAHHIQLPLSDSIRAEAKRAARLAERLEDNDLRRWAQEACEVVQNDGGAGRLYDGLRHRCHHAVEITNRYLRALEARP